MNLANWIDRVFGNNDGKFTLSDVAKSAPAVVALVVDLIMLVAEYRVLEVGHRLTDNWWLAVGFVAVSSIPFYMGQLAFLYNKANVYQQVIAVGMVLMGLCVSAYYGFSDLLMGTVVAVGVLTTDPLDPTALYVVAVGATVALIVGGLLYGLVDDTISQTIKESRLKGRAEIADREMNIMKGLLQKSEELLAFEARLRDAYGDDAVDRLSTEFNKKKQKPAKPANTPSDVPAPVLFTRPPQK